MGFNRTAVYYHFDTREALIAAVKAWSAAQLAKAFSARSAQHERIDYITRFVLENPQLIKLWIEELVSVGDIRGSYPHLTGAIIGPRVFKNRVCPGEDTETVVRRFRKEQQRWLERLALLRP